MVTDEQWKPLREFPEHYEISSFGRLRRTHAYHRNSVGKIRKPQLTKAGYVVYMLSADNKVRLRSAHRMVADAFLGPIPAGMEVNHKNGDKADPRLENLEIVSNSENRAHSYRILGIAPNRASGQRNTNAKLTWELVDTLRAELSAPKVNKTKLAAKYGVTRQTLFRLETNRAWRDEDRPPRPT